jgi:DNA gyrase subunit A
MDIGLVRSIDIDREMQQSYLDYAMSVIVARALPDARDGLKPVHRRILYAMFDMGIRPDMAYKKSARIVGEVLGKYHPHGDMAVYEAMARMAQPFSLRTLLVDGQGNFGSVDGDPPAAMRYTEARLAQPAMNMLADIQKDTVDFSENFDGSLKEPDVLPAALPNLLVNGATGIAVGMSTSIPPHNLGEVVDGLRYMLANWNNLDDLTVEDLMQFIKGPDFPTGGIIVLGDDEEGLTGAYGSGRGRVVVQARSHIEEMGKGRNRIIVTELPYMTNKSTLIERIAELVRDERLEGIADLRDESDRQGLRIVIELNKTANPKNVLQNLYKYTGMRSTFGIIMLALVEGEPRMLSLKQALRVYLEHRLEVVRRRSQFELERAKQRAHILEGLRIALKFLDEVIALIRKAPDAETARTRLIKRFKLTDVQAQAILDMPLRRLAALERKKIEDEYKELKAQIKELEALLRSPAKMRGIVGDELQVVKDTFADRRRTQIVQRNGSALEATVQGADLSLSQEVWISATRDGLIRRSLDDQPPAQSGSGAPFWTVRASPRDTLFLVGESGEAAGVPVHAAPEVDESGGGVETAGSPAYRISALSENDRLAGIFCLPPKEERPEGQFIFTGTRGGMVKKTSVSELPGATAKTFSLMKVNEGDRFGWIRMTGGAAEILLGTANGMAIRFSEDEVRPMGLGTGGVSGVKLGVGDEVIGMDLVSGSGHVLLVSEDGKAKRVYADHFPRQGRYGQGVAAFKTSRGSRLAGIALLEGKKPRATLHLERLAPKALKLDDIPLQTRAASGKPVLDLKGKDRVVGLVVIPDHPKAGVREVKPKRGGGPDGGKAPAKKTSTDGKGRAGVKGLKDGKSPGSQTKAEGTKTSAGKKVALVKKAAVKKDKKETSAKAAPAVKKTTIKKTAAESSLKPGKSAASKPKTAAAAGKPATKELPIKTKAAIKKTTQAATAKLPASSAAMGGEKKKTSSSPKTVKVRTPEELTKAVKEHPGEELIIEILRPGRKQKSGSGSKVKTPVEPKGKKEKPKKPKDPKTYQQGTFVSLEDVKPLKKTPKKGS